MSRKKDTTISCPQRVKQVLLPSAHVWRALRDISILAVHRLAHLWKPSLLSEAFPLSSSRFSWHRKYLKLEGRLSVHSSCCHCWRQRWPSRGQCLQACAADGSPPLKVQYEQEKNSIVVENKQWDLGFYLYRSDGLPSNPRGRHWRRELSVPAPLLKGDFYKSALHTPWCKYTEGGWPGGMLQGKCRALI